MYVFNRYDKLSCVSKIFDEFENPYLASSYKFLYKVLGDTSLAPFLLKTCQFYPEYEETLRVTFINSMSESTYFKFSEEARIANLWKAGANVNAEIIQYMRSALELLKSKLKHSNKYHMLLSTIEFKELVDYVETTSNVFHKIFTISYNLQTKAGWKHIDSETAEENQGDKC